jgi:histone-lysine N-methyltransferase SETDB1
MPSGDADTSRYIDKPLRGIIAEQPSLINHERYLIFADNDSPFYLRSIAIHLLLESLSNYLSKVDLGTKHYIENYVLTYPKRRLVNISAKDHINIELNGQWVDAIISKVEASLIRVFIPVLNKHEWLYRGSLRLQPLFNSLSSYEPPCKRLAIEKDKTIDSKCHFLLIPLNQAWKRQIRNDLGTIVYISPCGQMFTDAERLQSYLFQIDSPLNIKQFSFDMNCRVTQKFLSPKTAFVQLEDYSFGKENVPLMLVNEFDSSLPKTFEYINDRIPLTSDIIIEKTNIQGCSCIDGCLDTTKCACWKKTYDAIIQSHYYEDLIGELKELFEEEDDNMENMRAYLYDALAKRNYGYKHGRLLEKIHSGIYECNDKCKCDSRCTNRCVQFGLNTLLQVYNTSEKGWGVRTLYDLPAGTFLSFYAGEILNDEDANRRGVQKNMGDIYFTALDFVASLNPSARKPRPIINMNNGSHVEISSEIERNGSKFFSLRNNGVLDVRKI